MPRVRRLLHLALLFVSCGPCREKPPAPVERAGVPGRSGGASIHGTVRFRGTPPAPPRISRGSFAECAKAPALPATPLGVASGALAEAFVWVKRGLPEGDYPIPRDPLLIDQRGCEFIPRVLGVRAGQTVVFRNSDQTLHNVHAVGRGSNAFNFGMPVTGMEVKRALTEPQVTITVACDVHPWMRAFLGVVRHPFFAVTAADGRYELRGLPAGTYLVEAWTEVGRAEQTVTVGGQEDRAADFSFGP